MQISRADFRIKNEFTITNIRKAVNKLNSLTGNTFADYLRNLFEFYQSGDILYDECIKYAIAEEVDSFSSLKQYILQHLYLNADDEVLFDEELQDFNNYIDNFLNISIDIFECWFDYVNRAENKEDVIYHTFHSTKGLEFDNVLILLQKKFGKDNVREIFGEDIEFDEIE